MSITWNRTLDFVTPKIPENFQSIPRRMLRSLKDLAYETSGSTREVLEPSRSFQRRGGSETRGRRLRWG